MVADILPLFSANINGIFWEHIGGDFPERPPAPWETLWSVERKRASPAYRGRVECSWNQITSGLLGEAP